MIPEKIWTDEALKILSKKNGIRLIEIPNKSVPSSTLVEKIVRLFTEYDGREEARVRALEKLIPRYGKEDLLNNMLFTCYLEIGEFEKAEAILMSILDRDPRNLFVISAKLMENEYEEDMIKYGELLGEPRDAKLFFGTDEIFAGDYYDFQEAAMNYEIFKDAFIPATERLHELRMLGMPFIEFIDRAESIAMPTAIDTFKQIWTKKNIPEDELLIELAICLVATFKKGASLDSSLGLTELLILKLQNQAVSAMLKNVAQEDFMLDYEAIQAEGLLDDFGDIDDFMAADDFHHEEGAGFLNDFSDYEASAKPYQAPIVNMYPKVGRNDPCPCGSGKKHKKCCL